MHVTILSKDTSQQLPLDISANIPLVTWAHLLMKGGWETER